MENKLRTLVRAGYEVSITYDGMREHPYQVVVDGEETYSGMKLIVAVTNAYDDLIEVEK